MSTWGIFANQLRATAEHYPEDEYNRGHAVPLVFRTRDIINSWFDKWFIATRSVNLHLTHHLCPQVPFFNLPELQRLLAETPTYRKHAHVTYGYHRVVAEMLFYRKESVGRLEVA